MKPKTPPSIRFVLEKALAPMVQLIGAKQYEASQSGNEKRAYYIQQEADRLLHTHSAVMALVDQFEEKEQRLSMQLFKLMESENFHRSLTQQFTEQLEKSKGEKEAARLLKMQGELLTSTLKTYQEQQLQKETTNGVY